MVRLLRASSLLGAALLWAGCSNTPSIEFDGSAGPPTNTGGGGGSGGSGAGNGGGGGAGGAGAPVVDWGVPASPVGSFDVRILETKSEDSNGPKLGRAPSLGALLRVDFPGECGVTSGGVGGSSAIATPCVLRPDWAGKVLVTVQGSAPTAYNVKRDDRALILETDGTRAAIEGAVPVPSAAGAGGTGDQGTTYFATDRWERFTFALDAQGRVVPPVQAQAVQVVEFGNGQPTVGTNKLSANASFHADRTAPRAEVVVGSSFSPPGLQFPWDPLTVHFDEPIVLPEPGDVIVTTPVDGSAIPSLIWRWAPAESDVPDSLLKTFGATSYQGYWRGWDASPLDNTVRLGTFRDPSSNAGFGLEQKLKLAAAGPNAAPVHDFESDVSGMVLWGGAAFDTTGCEPTVPPSPANTRCVRFSFDNTACGLSEPAGLALRLEAPANVDLAALLLTARLRVDVAVPDATSVKLTQISAQVFWAGAQKPQYKELEVSPGSWVDVSKELDPPPVLEAPSVPPTNPRDLAIVLRSGGLFAADACRQSVSSSLPTIITIESIAVGESSTR